MSADQLTQFDTGVVIVCIAIYLLVWGFVSYVLARIGVKLGYTMGKAFIMAFIPIVNIFYILDLAEKPMWWFILTIIPIVNIVILALVWMRICVRLGKPDWWGILMLVPFANMVVPLILAFGKTEAEPAT